MKKLVLTSISLLLAFLFLGCAITPIVPIIPNEPTEVPEPTEVFDGDFTPEPTSTPVPTPKPELDIPVEAWNATSLLVQDDDFTMNAELFVPTMYTGEITDIELKDMIDRTDKSLGFIRDYLSSNAPSVYPAEIAALPVRFDFGNSQFGWWVEDAHVYLGGGDGLYVKELKLSLSSVFTERERLYIISLINSDSVGWEQMGFAEYLGTCICPYGEMVQLTPLITPKEPYYDAAVNAGYDDKAKTPESMRILYDVISRACFELGLDGWSSPMISKPVSFFTSSYYTRKYADKVNSGDQELSLVMAVSFIGWLDGKYGFEALSRFCFGQASFDEAFGTDYQTAFTAWKAHIMETYPEL
jgi:hypothetical protein